jgi:molecular chaperone GrpE (heat shock protein)
MKDFSGWKAPKWPFLVFGAALFVVAAILAIRPAHAITQMEIMLATASVALGAVLGCLPFVLDYLAAAKLVEMNALGTVAEQLAGLKGFTAQISDATDRWARVQDTTKEGAEKTAAAAREIADRMAAEIREFNEFQAKINDSEKATLRLEADKLRRSEGEWLQVVARILDHVFALNTAAARSGQPELAGQIGNFQTACRDAARRVGLALFEVDAGEKFDGQKHRAHGVENPAADSAIAELLAPGISFQGRVLRPALVRLRDANAPEPDAEAGPEPQPEAVAEKPAAVSESDPLTLEPD